MLKNNGSVRGKWLVTLLRCAIGWQAESPEGDALFPTDITKRPGNSGAIHIGDGAVIQSTSTRAESVATVLAKVIQEPASFGVPGLSPEASVDAKPDSVYVTVTTQDILLYNHGDTAQTLTTPSGAVEVPAHAIVSVLR